MKQGYCSLCGSKSRNIIFKNGRVCEDCIDYIKSSSEKFAEEFADK